MRQEADPPTPVTLPLRRNMFSLAFGFVFMFLFDRAPQGTGEEGKEAR